MNQSHQPPHPPPRFGAEPQGDGTWFRVWASRATRVELCFESAQVATSALRPVSAGIFETFLPGVGAGTLYRYSIDGDEPCPDPASRFQPRGVHGPSEVIDPNEFGWTDTGWRGVRLSDLVLYELHVGTFTPQGTFAGVTERLPYLASLGVTAIELMPVADFAGDRNWGYDGAALFAPSRAYGRPEDLRLLVDTAHQLGIAVLLDVVYNHLGPDGAYIARFAPEYFSGNHRTPWGAAINLDGPGCALVRSFIIQNALHWILEYHLDGLRLDATHALIDESAQPILAELSARVRDAVPNREVLLIAEDDRNLSRIVEPLSEGGWGFDALWADDFHHQVRRRVAGDHEGYYRDFSGTAADLATTVRDGWFYHGQHSAHFGGPRGTDPTSLSPQRFVLCIQNHDQIGNRALGERLHHEIPLASFRAASALLLCLPETPLLFMGQEWAATTPFLYFTDHHPELGRLVTEGRRREFRHFTAFADPAAREAIPDPQAASTFFASRLRWPEADTEPHAGILRLYRALLQLRRAEPALRDTDRQRFASSSLDDSTLLLRRSAERAADFAAVFHFGNGGSCHLDRALATTTPWQVLLHTEEARFALDPRPPRIEASAIHFSGPAAVLFHLPT